MDLTPLEGRPFMRSEAERLGLTRRMLQGKRFVMIHPGVYRLASTAPTADVLVRAALLALPPGAAVSGLTNLRLRGYDVGAMLPLHFATNRRGEVDRRDVTVHRHLNPLHVEWLDGVPMLGPERTFVDVATKLDDRRLLRVGDWLVEHSQATQHSLYEFAMNHHLNGVQRARRVSLIVRPGVASPKESDVRWSLHRAGLPEPDVNVDIHADDGSWLARGDLVYRRWKVLVEYDGWQHERDAAQRQWDHLRREQLEAAGWIVIVVTSADLKATHHVIARVRQALRRRGWSEITSFAA